MEVVVKNRKPDRSSGTQFVEMLINTSGNSQIKVLETIDVKRLS
jgi:hypothetical protein